MGGFLSPFFLKDISYEIPRNFRITHQFLGILSVDMDTEAVLLNSCAVSAFLIIWFKTNALIEYVRFFGLKDALGLNDYVSKQAVALELSFPMYLSTYCDSFLSRLFSCYLCTGFWLSIFFSAFDKVILTPVVFLISIFIYKIYERLCRV